MIRELTYGEVHHEQWAEFCGLFAKLETLALDRQLPRPSLWMSLAGTYNTVVISTDYQDFDTWKAGSRSSDCDADLTSVRQAMQECMDGQKVRTDLWQSCGESLSAATSSLLTMTTKPTDRHRRNGSHRAITSPMTTQAS